MQRVLLAVLPVVFVAMLFAQGKPDFSGRWVLASATVADPDVAESLTVKQVIARTNVFGAPMEPYFSEISIEREFVDHARTDTYQIGTAGGTIGGVGGLGGRPVTQSRVSVQWDADRLVIETSSDSGTAQAAQHSERKEIWQLDPTGTLTSSVSSSGSGIEPRSNVLTYRKD
jgi:hypothetical protein